jgi:hypothetical protein
LRVVGGTASDRQGGRRIVRQGTWQVFGRACRPIGLRLTLIGYRQAMPDFGDLEQMAKDHSQQVDEGIEKAKDAADKVADGRDHGMIDKGADAAEKALGGRPGDVQPDGQ